MTVYVLDKRQKPLMPCSEKRARLLLSRGRARVHKMMPFTIRLIDRTVEDSNLQPLRLKFDPGSKKTGLALVREGLAEDGATPSQSVLALVEIKHRGHAIRDALTARRALRRRRRGQLRYRQARFDNRTKPEGWLAPSLRHRVDTTTSQAKRMLRLAPITAIDMELVRFDMQLMVNPDISGVEYQQGTLHGYEVREYCLEKWGRTCIYCDATDVPLQIEHLVPRASGGSNRPSNLGIACEPCNKRKAAQPLDGFVKDKARLARIKKTMRTPLSDAAAVNATRWALREALLRLGLAVLTFTGGRTKWNRARLGVPKTHALDAACVGDVKTLEMWNQPTLQISCTGRGSYQRTRVDKYGFPRGYMMRSKSSHGFKTGDIVSAHVTKGKKIGTYVGRVAVRESGSFNITTASGVVQGIGHRTCRLLQPANGYGYQLLKTINVS